MAKLKTGRHTSAIKERRKTIKRTIFNKTRKKDIKQIIKKIEEAVNAKKKDEAQNLLKEAFSTIDKAKKRNIIHRNNAARKKSRLSVLVSKIG